MATANILNVQRFCTKDGPGIRTTVFFKGCPLTCLWCHNPESQSTKRQLMYNAEKCSHCLRCESACPMGCHTRQNGKHALDRTACASCGRCISPLCEALELAGDTVSTSDILAEVLKDALYYQNSGGGLTLSGGEPLMQSEACLELLRGAKENGLHTCVETCGFVSKDVLEKTMPWIDLYLFDWKESNPQKHKEYTGASNQVILDNLSYLDSMEKKTVLRCPIIPGINDREDHLAAIARLANGLRHLCGIVLEPYHTLGVGKYGRLGKSYGLAHVPPLDKDRAEQLALRLRDLTSVPVSIG